MVGRSSKQRDDGTEHRRQPRSHLVQNDSSTTTLATSNNSPSRLPSRTRNGMLKTKTTKHESRTSSTKTTTRTTPSASTVRKTKLSTTKPDPNVFDTQKKGKAPSRSRCTTSTPSSPSSSSSSNKSSTKIPTISSNRSRSRSLIRADSETTDTEQSVISHTGKRGILYTPAHRDSNSTPKLTSIQTSGLQQQQQQQLSSQDNTNHFMMVVFSVSFYFITSIVTVLLNKHLLDGQLEKSKVFITWVQILFTVVIGYPLSALFNIFSSMTQTQPPPPSSSSSTSPSLTTITPPSTITSQALNDTQTNFPWLIIQTFPAGVIFSLMLILNNLCLAYVHVAFYQVARSWTILMSMILTYYFFGDTPSRSQLLCSIVVVFGYTIACHGEVPWGDLFIEIQHIISVSKTYLHSWFNATAIMANNTSTLHLSQDPIKGSIVLGLISGFFSCFMVAYNAIISKQLQKTISRSHLITCVNLNAAAIMFIYMVISGEFQSTITNPLLYQQSVLIPLLVVSFSGYLLGYATQMQIQYTSALGHNVSGTAKASAQSIIAWFITPKPFSLLSLFGTAITIIGCGVYSLLPNQSKSTQQQQQQHKTVALKK